MIKKTVISSAKAMKEEISMTLMVISFFLIVLAGGLEIFEKTKSTGPFMELFGTCCGLYFGRTGVKAYVEYKKDKKKADTAKTEEL